MKLTALSFSMLFVPSLLAVPAMAQMDHSTGSMAMKHKESVPSTSLRITVFDDRTRSLTPDEFRTLPHTTVTVINGHSHKQESYSGVAVKDLLALVAAPKEAGQQNGTKKISPRTTIIVAKGTDDFRVVITLCDTDPGCRSGQAIVADSVDGKPLGTEGAFKLILTEDRMPGRWVHNLDALTETNVSAM